MLQNFSFAFNAVVPMVSLMGLGYWLKMRKFFDAELLKKLNAFTFRFGVSALMFCNVYSLPSLGDIPVDFMCFVLVSVFIITLLSLAAAMLTTRVNNRRGVMTQVGFRSNFAIIGSSLATAVGGTAGNAAATSIQAPGIIYFNIAAIVCLTVFSDHADQGIRPSKIFKELAKNPMLLGLFSGLLCLVAREWIPRTAEGALAFSLSGSLPFAYSVLQSLSNMTTPLLLIILGGQVDFHAVGDMKKEVVTGVAMRLVGAPAVGIAMALAAGRWGLLDMTPAIVSALLAFYGSPAAVAGAVMAEEMGGDAELARQYVVWTTTLSMVTMFLWIVLLRTVGLL